MLRSSAALKMKAVKEGAFKLLSALAHRYQQLDVVCGALVDLLNKLEHVPPILAELADFALGRYGDARLVRASSCTFLSLQGDIGIYASFLSMVWLPGLSSSCCLVLSLI